MAESREREDIQDDVVAILKKFLPDLPQSQLNHVTTPIDISLTINLNAPRTNSSLKPLLTDGSLQVFAQAHIIRGAYIRFRLFLECIGDTSTTVPIRLKWNVELKQNGITLDCGGKCCFVPIPLPSAKSKSSFLETPWRKLHPFSLDGNIESKWNIAAEWYRADAINDFYDQARVSFHHITDLLQETFNSSAVIES